MYVDNLYIDSAYRKTRNFSTHDTRIKVVSHINSEGALRMNLDTAQLCLPISGIRVCIKYGLLY